MRRWNRSSCAYVTVVPFTPSIRAIASPNSAARPSTASWIGSVTGVTSAYSLWNTIVAPRCVLRVDAQNLLCQ